MNIFFNWLLFISYNCDYLVLMYSILCHLWLFLKCFINKDNDDGDDDDEDLTLS